MDKELERSEALKALREALPSMIESHVLIAQMKMSQYRALLKAGFTEAQALELTKGWH